MRCFVAIDLPEEVKKELVKLQRELPEATMKLVEPENLHLTIEFLGELTDFQVNQCKQELKKIEFQKFKAYFSSVGFFPSEQYIRVVWVGLEPQAIIKGLHEKIHNALKSIVKLDERFESHITLARVKYIGDKKTFIGGLRGLKPRRVEFGVNSFALKKSTLTRQGPIYEDVVKFNSAD
jgi:2'-5' RNA ligase